MILRRLAQVSLTLCLCGALPCIASDEKREAAIALDIQKTVNIGKAIWLQTPEKKFLSLYLNSSSPEHQSFVILLHDIGGNPNQELVVEKLRHFLPNHRWASLSLQMPLREPSASADDYYDLFPEARQRLIAAIKFAQSEHADKIVIAGYGLGALMTTYALEDKSIHVDGLILISLPVTENIDPLPFISQFNLPILDIYAELDFPEVVRSAGARQLAGKKNSHYRQVKIENEGHQYSNDNDRLLKLIYGWVNRIVANDSLAGPPRPKGDLVFKGAQGIPGAPGLKGNRGETGIAGDPGIEGIQGLKGDLGRQGEQGEQGAQGTKGETGIAGIKGDPGSIGDLGLKGDQGLQGASGDKGTKGDNGIKGDAGIKGNKGPQGSKGDAGPKGEKGIAGNDGIKGDIGLKGDAGPKGDPGAKGEQGIKGDEGPKGDNGPKGDQGIKGDSGPKGDIGPKGEQGIKGDIGPKGNIGPKGDTGPKGDRGPASN